MSFSLRGLWKEAVQPETLRAVPFILMGCLVTAVGLVYFINPYGIVPGGVFGLSIVLHAIFHLHLSELLLCAYRFRF